MSHCPRVLHVVHSVDRGGTERFLCRLVKSLSELGLEQAVCTLRDPGERAKAIQGLVDVHSLNVSGRDRGVFVRLAKVIRKTGSNIVHARNWGTWTDTLLACRIVTDAKPVLGFHGLQYRGGFNWRQRVRACIFRMNKQLFTTVSEAAGRFLVESINCKPENVQVLPNGVDSGRFELSRESRSKARDRFGLGDDDYVIGNVGNFFSAVKGHGTLVKAFALVAPEVKNAKLLLVGVGPLQKDILELVRSYDLEAHVFFADGVEDVSEVLPAMDVYVCPSDSEGMSNAVLEAMACSLPCVVTDVSDHRQMFSESDWDCLIEPGDYRGLAGKLRVLADAPQVGKRLGLLARDRVRGEYDYMKVVQRYKRFYEAVSEGGGSSSFRIESPQDRGYHEAVTEVIPAGTDGGVSVV